ncbi:MAG: MBL fold metallo-hydrolase [Candidatus Cloacimonadota bacterium]|nr:MAG: MBL fold metallo-hydrolase [Candidatus Cloacimonadota bacterium]
MQIANYKITSIESGMFKLDGGAMFGVIPKVLWNKTNPADENNQIDMGLRTLLLESGKRKILIDTGIGHKFNEKKEKMFGIDYTKHSMDKYLKKSNLTSDDITDVFLTHLHFDHAGGNTYIDENGEIKATFKNAIYHVDKFHFEWAIKPSRRDRASFLKENFEILIKNGQLNLFDGGHQKQLFKNTEIVKVHGHTPHQCLLKIIDEKNTLLYCADLIPTSSHIPLPYIMGYDLNPLQTLSEKEIILEDAYQNNWILFFEHDPKIQASTILKTDRNDYKMKEVIKI